ncbi:hypothetical protein C8T65DRAFT_632850 [Cerioporus squamosus]|nr:hypothetical protein C8T65DRAFT_632850 [Cerioporus squamosus]
MTSIAGSCSGNAALILLDPSASQSRMSSKYALTYNIPRTVSFDSGHVVLHTFAPVVTPTPSGWYTSSLPLVVDYVRDYDIVLGRDWFQHTRPVLSGGVLCDPGPHGIPSSSVVNWERSPVLQGLFSSLPPDTDFAGDSLSADDRTCASSSSHSLGSSLQVAGASRWDRNVLYAISYLQAICLAHGIVDAAGDVALLQYQFLTHVMSGECASGSCSHHSPLGHSDGTMALLIVMSDITSTCARGGSGDVAHATEWGPIYVCIGRCSGTSLSIFAGRGSSTFHETTPAFGL